MQEFEKIVTIVATGVIIFTVFWKFIGSLFNRIINKFIDRIEKAIDEFARCKSENDTWKAVTIKRIEYLESEVIGISRRKKRDA